MNKKIITAVVCAQLLITPTAHAWELPANIDSRKISIAAGITAILLTLVGITCYAYKKRGQHVPIPTPHVPSVAVGDRAGQGAAPLAAHGDDVLVSTALKRYIVEREAVLRTEFMQQQQVQKESFDASIRELVTQFDDWIKKHDELRGEYNHSKGMIQQAALEVATVKRQLAALPKREDLENFKKEQEIARRNDKRALDAAVLRLISLRNISVESDPELTQLALAINSEATGASLTDSAKVREQEKEQALQLQKARAALRPGKKRAQAKKPEQEAVLFSTTSCQATLPDGHQHSPSEMGAGLGLQGDVHSVSQPALSGSAIRNIAASPLENLGAPVSSPLAPVREELSDADFSSRSLTGPLEPVQVEKQIDLHALERDLEETETAASA